MALTIAQDVAERIEQKAKPSRYLVKFKKRFFDIATQAFKFEAAFTDLAKTDVRSISASREAVDRKGVNVFQASNITIEIENRLNKWNPKNPDGLLAADAVAPLGYEPQLMEFVVEMFYEVEDGTESVAIPIFTGRAVAFDFKPSDDTVAVTLESKAILTKRADAEKVSITALDETMTPAPDGANKEFLTVEEGIGRIDAVRLDGVDQQLGVAVRVSQLNDAENKAKATFTTAPPVSSVPKDDNIEWRKNRLISDLVGLLADEAGITLTERTIDPVIFPNLVLNKKIFTSKADWDAGTFSQTGGVNDLETDVSPGDMSLEAIRVFDDFDDGSFDPPPRQWTPAAGDPGWTISGGVVFKSGFSTNSLSTPSTKTTGTWEVRMQLTGNTGQMNFVPLQSAANPFSGNGYELLIILSTAGTSVRLLRRSGGSFTTIFSGGGNSDGNFHTYRLTRDSSGLWKIYKDGSLIGSVTDNTFTSSGFIAFFSVSGSSPAWDDVRTTLAIIPGSDEVLPSGNNVTATFDTGPGNPVNYGLLDRIENVPSGASTLYETAVADESSPGSDTPGTFDAFVAIAGTGQILSAAKRFIKARSALTADGTNTVKPILSELTINFTSVTTSIKLADFTRLTVFQAISELAKFANFEWGFQRDGKLFFRARTPATTPVLTIELESLAAFNRISDGVDRVFNQIRARYGAHEKFANPVLQNDPKPNSFDRFGVRVLNVGSTQLLADNDADVATGLSRSYLTEFKLPRRRFEMEIDLRPQLELADTVLLRIKDNLPDPPWHVGDTAQAVGNKNIQLFGEAQQSAFAIKGRILSLRHDIGRLRTGLEIEEIL